MTVGQFYLHAAMKGFKSRKGLAGGVVFLGEMAQKEAFQPGMGMFLHQLKGLKI